MHVQDSNVSHNVAECWSSVVHTLATAIHVKPDFLNWLKLDAGQPGLPAQQSQG